MLVGKFQNCQLLMEENRGEEKTTNKQKTAAAGGGGVVQCGRSGWTERETRKC